MVQLEVVAGIAFFGYLSILYSRKPPTPKKQHLDYMNESIYPERFIDDLTGKNVLDDLAEYSGNWFDYLAAAVRKLTPSFSRSPVNPTDKDVNEGYYSSTNLYDPRNYNV
jgi:hypothetical protein